jgi:ketosteroid isomerase-like protein
VNHTTPYGTLQLAEAISRYQDAHDRHDTERALGAFTPDGTVVDENRHYRGADEIRHWLETVSREFTYTRTLVSAEATTATNCVVVNHLEGDFPGGVVDLRYQFTLTGDLISELLVTP